MAYRAYQPTKPKFRTVNKIRGKNLDNVTREMMASYNHNPWNSIYVKEISNPQKGRQGPMIATHGKNGHSSIISQRSRQKRAKGTGRMKNTLDNLNDNVSVNSFKTRQAKEN